MKSNNVTYYRIPYGTEAWTRFRTTGLTEEDAKEYNCPQYQGGIGGSEIGAVLGLSQWRPVAAEYYHYKIGTETPNKIENRAMLMGKILEPIVKDLWCAYDGTEENWVYNYLKWIEAPAGTRAKEQVRRARKVNAYLVNKNYPYLFVSLDYHTEQNTPGILSSEIFEDGFPVEIKTINGMYAQKWQNEIPAYHIAQVNTQMIVTESDYCELAILIDGRVFKVMPINRDEKLCKSIINNAKNFWEKVLEGRAAAVKMNKAAEGNSMLEYERQRSIIDSNEPEPDNTEAYTDYLKEKYQKVFNSVSGTIEQYDLCQEDAACQLYATLLDRKRTFIENTLIKVMVDTGAEELNFGNMGKFTYKQNAKGSMVKRFDLTTKPSMAKAEEELSKLNFNLLR